MEKKKIVIACDSYKGCLTSKEVNFQLGVRSEELGVNADIVTLEMSDGGDGMLDAFLSAMGGERVAMHAHDALMRWIDAEYGIANDTAIIEKLQSLRIFFQSSPIALSIPMPQSDVALPPKPTMK